MDAMPSFNEVAPYLRNPLVLIGFVLLLVFTIHYRLAKAGIIPTLSKEHGLKVTLRLLGYGFWIAVIVIVLGFVLAFYRGYLEAQRRPTTGVQVTAPVIPAQQISPPVVTPLEPSPPADKRDAAAPARSPSVRKASVQQSNPYQPPYPEPTEAEMRHALLQSIEGRGGVRKGDDVIASENPLAGMAVEIVAFEKVGCRPSVSASGYVCDYSITTSLTAYSNEGSASAEDHARGVNGLIKLLMGGKENSTETVTRRFLKSRSGWVVADR